MTDIIAKGGRGLKAPYETTHARIPKDAKAVVEKLSAVYRQKFVGQVDPDSNGANLLLEQVEKAIDGVVIEKPVNKNYQEVRDRILKRVRSDKLKAVVVARGCATLPEPAQAPATVKQEKKLLRQRGGSHHCYSYLPSHTSTR